MARQAKIVSNRLLISEVQAHPLLWNMALNDYKKTDTKHRDRIWAAIGERLEKSGKSTSFAPACADALM